MLAHGPPTGGSNRVRLLMIMAGLTILATACSGVSAGPPTIGADDSRRIDLTSDEVCQWARDITGNIGIIARGASHGTLPDGRVVVEPDHVRPSDALIEALRHHDVYSDGTVYKLAEKCLPPIEGLAAERHVIDWETGERFPLPDDVDLDDLGPQPDQTADS